MKSALQWLVALVLGVSLLTACAQTPGEEVAVDDVIRIGLNLEWSGHHGEEGNAVVQGVQLAADQINAAGGLRGRQIALIGLDNMSDPVKAVTLATKLSTQDKAVAIIGPAKGWIFTPAASVTSHQEIPNVSPMATDGTALLNPDGQLYPYAFRVALSDPAQGAAMARYAAETLGATRALVLRDDSAIFTNELADGFVTTFTEGGGTVVTDAATPPGTDPGTIAASVMGNDYDVVYLASYVNEAAPLIGPLRSAGVDAPILGTDSMMLPTLVEVAGPVSDVYYPAQFFGQDPENPLVAPFVESFQATFGLAPNSAAALGYDSMLLLADAIARADDVSGIEINQALAATSGFQGVTGNYTFGDNHEPGKAPLVVQMANGQPNTVQRAF